MRSNYIIPMYFVEEGFHFQGLNIIIIIIRGAMNTGLEWPDADTKLCA